MRLTQIGIDFIAVSREKVSVKGSRDAYEILKPYFGKNMEYKELFFVIYLNRANNVVGVDPFPYNYAEGEQQVNSLMKVSEGGKNGTVVDICQIFQGAILTNASSLIVAHNHPSGNTTPSQNDKEITKKIKQACNIFDLSLLDHVILTESDYHSFADCGDL